MISLYINLSNDKNCSDGEQISGCHRSYGWERVTIKGQHNGVFVGADGTALYSNCGRGYTNLHVIKLIKLHPSPPKNNKGESA